MKKIKVLQLHPDYNIRTLDISDLGEQIFKGLPSEKYETTNAFFQGKPAEEGAISCADKSVYFEFSKQQMKGLRLLVLIKLFLFMKKEQFDVVICNRYKPVNILLTLGHFFQLPLCLAIVHGEGDYDRAYRKRQVKKRLKKNWHYIAVSGFVKNYLLSLNCGFNDSNVSIINNAIDVPQAREIMLSKESAREQLNLSGKSTIVGALGRLIPLKGYANLIKAFALIHNDFPSAEIAILGEGREKENLTQLIEKLELTKKIHLLGFKENGLQYIKAFDVFAMPSFTEGLPLALLEGMSAEVPIIASNIPAIAPILEGTEAALIDPHDIESIKNALVKFLSITHLDREAIGKKLYSHVLENYDVQDYRNQYRMVIERQLAVLGEKYA